MPRNPNEERDNPCLKEQNLSYKCLSTNNYERDLCETFFVNYNNCKAFWGKVKSDRRSKGIRPFLPDPADRDAIKAEYMKSKGK